MKKRLNIILFSICFLAALLAETYCIQVLDGDLLSVVGIGAVLLITGYLLMDSIRSKLAQSSERVKFYVDHIYSEETQKWNERYTELLNMQKATYTAAKKNTAMMSEQFGEVVLKLEALEVSNAKSLQKLIELQMKSLEGQKNSLNLEINYSKENTKQLMKVLREEGNRFDLKEDLSKIIANLEENNTLLKERMNDFGTMSNEFEFGARKQTGYVQDLFENNEESLSEDFYNELNMEDHIDEDKPDVENASEASWSKPTWEESLESIVAPEIEGYAVEAMEEIFKLGTDTYETDSVEIKDNSVEAERKKTDDILNDLLNNISTNQENSTGNGLVQEDSKGTVKEEIAATVSPVVVPLYNDPNKALTADEIAALFASFGQ